MNANLNQIAATTAALQEATELPYAATLEDHHGAVSIIIRDVTGEDTLDTTDLPIFGDLGLYSGGLSNPNVKSDALAWLRDNGWETIADPSRIIAGYADSVWRVTEPLPVRPAATDDLSCVAVAASRIGQAEKARDEAIRAALDAGHSVISIAKAAGLSRERIYQIRDGRR
jgi:hypothetical protein